MKKITHFGFVFFFNKYVFEISEFHGFNANHVLPEQKQYLGLFGSCGVKYLSESVPLCPTKGTFLKDLI